jgi:hypothetical protein
MYIAAYKTKKSDHVKADNAYRQVPFSHTHAPAPKKSYRKHPLNFDTSKCKYEKPAP